MVLRGFNIFVNTAGVPQEGAPPQSLELEANMAIDYQEGSMDNFITGMQLAKRAPHLSEIGLDVLGCKAAMHSQQGRVQAVAAWSSRSLYREPFRAVRRRPLGKTSVNQTEEQASEETSQQANT